MYDSLMYKRPPHSPKRPRFPVAEEGSEGNFAKSGPNSLSAQFSAQQEGISSFGTSRNAHGTVYLGGYRRIGLDVTLT